MRDFICAPVNAGPSHAAAARPATGQTGGDRRHMHWVPYEAWLNPGDNAWQMTAATLVGLMSVPGLAVLYGGVMQKRWSVNSIMLTFVAFCLVLVAWVLWAFKMGFGESIAHSGSGVFGAHGFLGTALGKPGSVLGHAAEQGHAVIPTITTVTEFNYPQSSLAYLSCVVHGRCRLAVAGLERVQRRLLHLLRRQRLLGRRQH